MFSITPPSLRFSSFRPGKPQHHSLLIANNTPHKVHFWIDFPKPYTNYFEFESDESEIESEEQVEVRVVFIPQLIQDMELEARVCFEGSGQEWTEAVRITCSSKKISLVCKESVLDFGEVVLREKKELSLELVNQNLDKLVILFQNNKGKSLANRENLEQDEVEIMSQLEFPYQWVIDQQTSLIPIKYSPNILGPFSLSIQFIIKNNTSINPYKITIKGECIEVPLYLEKVEYDMKICIVGHFYKEEIIVYNRYESPLKIEIQQPKETKKYIEFIPNIGFIQKYSKLSIWFRLNILKDIESYLQPFLFGDVYVLPFTIVSKSQTIPVDFRIKFKITTNKLVITPTMIDFGNIYQGTGSKISVTLRNESILFQEVMLFPSSNNIHVMRTQPIKILPKQQLECQLLYLTTSSPTNDQQTKKEETIKCEIITGDVSAREISLNTVCTILKPYLQLQVNKIHFPVMQIEESFSTEIKMKNNSDEHIVFEIFLPAGKVCGLTMSPLVKILAPKETINLNIQYTSFFKNLDLQNLQEIERRKSFNLIDRLTNYILNNKYFNTEIESKSMSSEEHISRLGGRYSHFDEMEHFEWLIPIYFKQKEYPDASAEVTFLEITTTSCEKFLTLSETEVDFGEIPVGVKVTKQLTLKNLREFTEISKVPLSVWCGFKVVNTFKSLNMNQKQTINIEFSPNDERSFCQKLIIQSDKTEVSCILKGKGIRPKLVLDPIDGLMNMGSILASESSTRTFKIRNSKSFQTYFRIQLKQQGMKNAENIPAFTYIPKEGYIPPFSETQVEVKFSPTRPSNNYYQYLHITIPQQKQIPLYIYGESKSKQSYITIHNTISLPNIQQLQRIENNPFFHIEQQLRLLLTFDNHKGMYSNKIRIGNCKRLEDSQRQYFFKVCVPEERFRCSVSEGMVMEGEEVVVEIEHIFIQKSKEIRIKILEQINHWQDMVGTVTMFRYLDDMPVDTNEYKIILRAYYNYI